MIRRSVLAPLAAAITAACSPTRLASALTPLSGLQVRRDIRYAPHAAGLLDLYEPEGLPPGEPLLVFFYGGGWQTGGRAEYRFAARALAGLGAAVAVPDYRLYPAGRWPDFVEDGAAAVDSLRAAHPGRPVVAMGHSAGAFIAVALAVDPRWGVQDALSGAVGLAGPYQFGPEYAAYAPIFAAAPDGWARALPEDTSPAGSPPLLLLHGAEDRVARPRQSTFLAERAQAAGVPARAVLYPGVGHIGIMAAFAPPVRALGLARAPVLEDVAAFLAGMRRAARAASG
ncbi:MAG TPA: alpha/beta hydrolase [Acetobacteraceae bacterium]|nr:alpha/beta hydrolase [Acetobacteraceae bacterium]